tara:strand:+ start:1667 stop:3988 length:2322 start_codon:yes stop_codon:yes gene_type:complete
LHERVAKATNAAFLLCVVGPRRKERGERKTRERKRETRTREEEEEEMFGAPNSATNQTQNLFGGTTPLANQNNAGTPQQQQQQQGGGGGLFGNAGNGSQSGNASGGGLFGNASVNQGGGGGGLFGNTANAGAFGTGTQQQQQQQGGGGGGLFGNASAPSSGGGGGGGLFGAATSNGNATQQGGLFGNANANTTSTQGGGLFSKPPASGGGGLFGGGTSGGGGLFGNGAQQNQTNATTAGGGGGLFGGGGGGGGSGLFGNPAGKTTTSGGGLFGGGGGSAGGGLFGTTTNASGNQQQQQQQNQGSGLFGGGQQQQTTSSLFGNRPLPLGGTQPQNQQGLTQVQQQHNAFYNVPESITTQAQGGPTLFGGNLAPSEALLRARQQRHIASQPPANGTTLEPVKELQDVMNSYNPQHPDYRFKAFFYNIAQDPRQKVKIQNIDERTWHELLDKVGGEENENGLWPCRVDGFDGLYQREQGQEEELKSQEAFVNAYNQCIRQINSWKEGSYEVRRTQCERRREEHAHRVLRVMRKLESFRAAYHRRVNPQLSTSSRRGGSGTYNRGVVNGGSTFVSKEERELFEVLQNLKRALDGSGKESLSRQAQQLTTTVRVKTQELSRQLATSPLRGGGGSLLAGTANGGYENNNRTTSPPSSSSGQRRNTKKSNTPVLLQPYDRERTTVTKTDLEDLASHKDVVDRLAGNIKSMREDLTRMCLAYGLPPVTTATSDPSQQPSQHQHQHTGGIFGQHQGQDQQRQNPALAAHQYGAAPTRSNAFF